MTKPLYVFDMDETLVNADCAMLWHEFLVEQKIATNPNFIAEDKRLMGLYVKGVPTKGMALSAYNCSKPTDDTTGGTAKGNKIKIFMTLSSLG